VKGLAEEVLSHKAIRRTLWRRLRLLFRRESELDRAIGAIAQEGSADGFSLSF